MFKENELVLYQNGSIFQIGRIKEVRSCGAFVYYHSGGTAAFTPFTMLHKLSNAHYIQKTSLGELAEEDDTYERIN